MSSLPYLCDFRMVVHVWSEEMDPVTQEVIEWGPGLMHEVLWLETWSSGFNFPSKDESQRFCLMPVVATVGPKKVRCADYGQELLGEGDLVKDLIDNDIKSRNEAYYEIVGKLYEHSYQDYEGEWDTDTEIESVDIQEISYVDVKWLLEDREKIRRI